MLNLAVPAEVVHKGQKGSLGVALLTALSQGASIAAEGARGTEHDASKVRECRVHCLLAVEPVLL